METEGLSDLGYKIFLDRYAQKDPVKAHIQVGDTVLVCIDQKTGQREIGEVKSVTPANEAEVEIHGEPKIYSLDHIDKPIEVLPSQMMARVARGIAAVEHDDARREEWRDKFENLLNSGAFVPAGRILTAAGTEQQLTLFNCYVIPSPKDSRQGIMNTLSEMTEIMSRGGGVGINVSSLRPKFNCVKGVNGRSSGAVSWGGLYSFVTGLIEQGGSRRGALMLILDDWHPDVIDFIHSKREAGNITNANISVAVSDLLMEAVKNDDDWTFYFPDTSDPQYNENWNGNLEEWRKLGGAVIQHQTIKARDLWNQIIESAWASAEPGVFFVDRYNALSNSYYYSSIRCTNPCGEQGIPPNAVCNLGAIHLGKMVRPGKIGHAAVDWGLLCQTVARAVRFLDNVIDATPYFSEANEIQQKSERRVGLGIMGLAELLIRVGVRYGSPECNKFLGMLFEAIASEAYTTSAEIAAEKGDFPLFDAGKFLTSGYVSKLPYGVKAKIKKKGCRNVTLLTIAPTGTTSTAVGTSGGIEPYYAWSYFRKSRLGVYEERVAILDEWIKENRKDGESDEETLKRLPDYFVTAMELKPEEHVGVQAVAQRWIDSSISKTCNVPNDYTVEQTRELYELMYSLGCKGGTIYRDGSRDVQVLNLKKDKKEEIKEAIKEEAKVRERPYKRYGVTVSQSSPSGTAHITMNDDADGRPFEVFVDIGKGGSDVKAMAEAMGRLMSLLLRMNSPLSPRERVEEIVGQLKGIGGARSTGFGANKVRSLPDAVAIALEEHYGHDTTLLDESVATVKQKGVHADACPSCGVIAFVRKEGCHTCESCGYSEC